MIPPRLATSRPWGREGAGEGPRDPSDERTLESLDPTLIASPPMNKLKDCSTVVRFEPATFILLVYVPIN